MEAAIAAGILIGTMGISWGVSKATTMFQNSRVKRLDEQLNGNGQEGLIVKVTRVETKVDEMRLDINEIKEAVKR